MKRLLYIILLICSTEYEALSQYSWSVVHSDQIGDTSFVFGPVSCAGSYCTVVGGYVVEQTGFRRIWNSSDWGKTWVEIDPVIPDSLRGKGFRFVTRTDSLHIFITGEQGLFLYSSDNGIKWSGRTVAPVDLLISHFSPNNKDGIAVGRAMPVRLNRMFITTTGGATWEEVPMSYTSDLRSCYSMGDGEFKVLNQSQGPIYFTMNNWATRDSIVDIVQDSTYSVASFMIFENYILGHGTHLTNNTGSTRPTTYLRGMITRTVNGGESWETHSLKPIDSGGVSAVWTITKPDRDTLVAGGWSNNHILMSFDRGATWRFDTLPVPKREGYTDVYDLVMMDNGNILGRIASERLNARTSLILGEPKKASVQPSTETSYLLRAYPNPTSTSISIVDPAPGQSVQIIDALGRIVLSFTMLEEEQQIDVSTFTSGIYSIVAGLRSGKFIVSR